MTWMIHIGRTEDGHVYDFLRTTARSGEARFILSTLIGCPVRCVFCDAGGRYEGRLTASELLGQIDTLVAELPVDAPFTVDFSRMGEPSFNGAVLDVLRVLRGCFGDRARAHLSTVASASRGAFFRELAQLSEEHFSDGGLSLRLSLHATDEQTRRVLVPVKCLTFAEASAALQAVSPDRIELYFARVLGVALKPERLLADFPPTRFGVTLAELVPTHAADKRVLRSQPGLDEERRRFEAMGYRVRVEPADQVEQTLGQSCGLTRAGDRSGAPRPRRLLVT